MFLQPSRHQPECDSQQEHRTQHRDILPFHPPAFPPEQKHQYGRQRTGHRLDPPCGQHLERNKRQQRPQIKHRREQVLEFGDPGHRFHLHRVDGEHCCGKPRARDAQLLQHHPEQQRIQRMHQDIDSMVPDRPQSPQVIFHPIAGELERVVLLVGQRLEPDSLEAMQRG